MSLKNFSKQEKQIAWKVLDYLQNEIPTNQTLVLQDVLRRFDLIQELKDKLDVRTIEEKVPAESLLFNSSNQTKDELSNLQPNQNGFYSLLGKRQCSTATVTR